MTAVITWLRTTLASVRLLLLLTIVLGIAYPLAVIAIAQVPGLHHKADGSVLTRNGRVVGSALLGQSFTDAQGHPLRQYFQPRPSAAGAGYDATASGASNLGPESVVDQLPDPSLKGDAGKPSLLTQVCARSLAIGHLEGVDGRRPYCTSTGVGAVLAVYWSGPGYRGHVVRVVSVNEACPATPFLASYRGVRVECARFGADYARGQIVPLRGAPPAQPAVPADAVTASGSGLDPGISPAYARIQQARVAQARGITIAQVQALVERYTDDRALGFLGEPTVAVLPLNLALDRAYPVPAR